MDAKQLRLSIVIPAYNVESYIGEAIESVLQQTVKPYEIIVVIDGSTDSTLEIAKTFTGRHLRFKIYSTENRGLGPARNFGLERATGNYVYFFDSDDFLSPRFVEEISLAVTSGNPDIVLFSGRSFCDKGFDSEFFPKYNRNLNGNFDSGPSAARSLLYVKGLFPSACLYVSRKNYILENGLYFKPIVHEDEAFFIPFLLLAKDVTVLDKELFYRRLRHGSIMTAGKSTKNLIGLEESIKTLIDFRKKFPDHCKAAGDVWLHSGQKLLLYIIRVKKAMGLKRVDSEFFRNSRPFLNFKFFILVLYQFLPDKFREIARSIKDQFWRK